MGQEIEKGLVRNIYILQVVLHERSVNFSSDAWR